MSAFSDQVCFLVGDGSGSPCCVCQASTCKACKWHRSDSLQERKEARSHADDIAACQAISKAEFPMVSVQPLVYHKSYPVKACQGDVFLKMPKPIHLVCLVGQVARASSDLIQEDLRIGNSKVANCCKNFKYWLIDIPMRMVIVNFMVLRSLCPKRGYFILSEMCFQKTLKL